MTKRFSMRHYSVLEAEYRCSCGGKYGFKVEYVEGCMEHSTNRHLFEKHVMLYRSINGSVVPYSKIGSQPGQINKIECQKRERNAVLHKYGR